MTTFLTPLPSASPKMSTFGGSLGIICEGVKQIWLVRVNKKKIFIPAGVKMFFTPSQKRFRLGAGRLRPYENAQNMAFFAQKMPFVNNCEPYIFTVYYY
jgi:hypothetical protein